MSNSLIRLHDKEGTEYEDNESQELTEAFKKAEKYLKYEFSDEFGYELEI